MCCVFICNLCLPPSLNFTKNLDEKQKIILLWPNRPFPQILALDLVIMMLAWRSRGIGISDLTSDTTVNYRNPFYVYVAIGFLTIIYVMLTFSLGCGRIPLPAILVCYIGCSVEVVEY